MARTGYVTQGVMDSPNGIMAGGIRGQTGLYCTCCFLKPLLWMLVCFAHPYPTPVIHQIPTVSVYPFSARPALHDRNGSRKCSSPGKSVDTTAPQTLTKKVVLRGRIVLTDWPIDVACHAFSCSLQRVKPCQMEWSTSTVPSVARSKQVCICIGWKQLSYSASNAPTGFRWPLSVTQRRKVVKTKSHVSMYL